MTSYVEFMLTVKTLNILTKKQKQSNNKVANYRPVRTAGCEKNEGWSYPEGGIDSTSTSDTQVKNNKLIKLSSATEVSSDSTGNLLTTDVEWLCNYYFAALRIGAK